MKKIIVILAMIMLFSLTAISQESETVDYSDPDTVNTDFATNPPNWEDASLYTSDAVYSNPTFWTQIPDDKVESISLEQVVSSGNLGKMSPSQLSKNLNDMEVLDDLVKHSTFDASTFSRAVQLQHELENNMMITFADDVQNVKLSETGALTHTFGNGETVRIHVTNYAQWDNVDIKAVSEQDGKRKGFIINGQKIISDQQVSIGPGRISDKMGNPLVNDDTYQDHLSTMGAVEITRTLDGRNKISLEKVGSATVSPGVEVKLTSIVPQAHALAASDEPKFYFDPDGTFATNTISYVELNGDPDNELINNKKINIVHEGVGVRHYIVESQSALSLFADEMTKEKTKIVEYSEEAYEEGGAKFNVKQKYYLDEFLFFPETEYETVITAQQIDKRRTEEGFDDNVARFIDTQVHMQFDDGTMNNIATHVMNDGGIRTGEYHNGVKGVVSNVPGAAEFNEEIYDFVGRNWKGLDENVVIVEAEDEDVEPILEPSGPETDITLLTEPSRDITLAYLDKCNE